MMKRFLVTTSLLLTGVVGSFAQGTAFTYQGRLASGTNIVSGSFDFTFSVFNVAVGAGQVGATLTNSQVAVSNGLFTVTPNFGPGVFDGSPRWLQITVRTNGLGAFATLVPRQPITATPYAIVASNVTGTVNASQLAGFISAANIGAGSITSNALAPGSVTATSLAAGAAAANLAASGQSAVPSGGVILSSNFNDAVLTAAGYVRLAQVSMGDVWEQRTAPGAPSARRNHSAVWTGSELLIWAGYNGGFGGFIPFNDGARFNPALNTWTPIPTNNAPSPRAIHASVWTGSEMIVWGGTNGVTYLNDGGRYNPLSNVWNSISTVGAPTARAAQTVVWTGTEMIIWGGEGIGGYFNTGGKYNPVSNVWNAVTTTGAPVGRFLHTAVWSGTYMVVWGGYGATPLNSGGRYSPVSNVWSAVTATRVPAARYFHTAVWTGDLMLVWGGYGTGTNIYNSGGRYNPATNGWALMSAVGAPSPRAELVSAWTGTEMIVWSGYNLSEVVTDGGRYFPSKDGWSLMTTTGAPASRDSAVAVWTGSELLTFGGVDWDTAYGDLYGYKPPFPMYLYQKP